MIRVHTGPKLRFEPSRQKHSPSADECANSLLAHTLQIPEYRRGGVREIGAERNGARVKDGLNCPCSQRGEVW